MRSLRKLATEGMTLGWAMFRRKHSPISYQKGMPKKLDCSAGRPTSGHALRETWIFFALTFAISWGVGAAFLLLRTTLEPLFGPLGPGNPAFYIVAYAPTLSALILAAAFGGGAGVQSLLATLGRPFAMIWLIVAIFLIPAIALVLICILPIVGYTDWPVSIREIFVSVPAVLFGSWQLFKNTGPLGEELGWRGYALPRLLQKWNALSASLLLGFVWTLWHVPAFFLDGIMGQSFSGFLWWALDTFALTIVITWLYLRANRNVLVAGLVPHFIINGMGGVGAWLSRPVEAVALALVAVAIVMLNRQLFLRSPSFYGDI
jgi:membrane protease YdiL (CAAX protease family)